MKRVATWIAGGNRDRASLWPECLRQDAVGEGAATDRTPRPAVLGSADRGTFTLGGHRLFSLYRAYDFGNSRLTKAYLGQILPASWHERSHPALSTRTAPGRA